MPTIYVKNLQNKSITIDNERQSILLAFIDKEQDWMHACGGKGRCTTCGFNVLEGMDQLSAPTHVEENFRKEGRLQADQRLACQTRCLGEVTIEVPASNQLPHVAYGA